MESDDASEDEPLEDVGEGRGRWRTPGKILFRSSLLDRDEKSA